MYLRLVKRSKEENNWREHRGRGRLRWSQKAFCPTWFSRCLLSFTPLSPHSAIIAVAMSPPSRPCWQLHIYRDLAPALGAGRPNPTFQQSCSRHTFLGRAGGARRCARCGPRWGQDTAWQSSPVEPTGQGGGLLNTPSSNLVLRPHLHLRASSGTRSGGSGDRLTGEEQGRPVRQRPGLASAG